MIKVQFKHKTDCLHIYQMLSKCLQQLTFESSHIDIRSDSSHQLFISFGKDSKLFSIYIQPLLSHVLTDYILASKEKKWLFSVLENVFYYTDYEEKNEIIAIARAIMDGEKKDLPKVDKFKDRAEMIKEAFLSFLTKEVSFCFDSFITFRLKEYHQMLQEFIGVAIDEYKLEQDYQNYIQSLRCFIKKKKPVIEMLHLIYGEKPLFFDENYTILTGKMRQSIVSATDFCSCDFEIDPLIIQPLLALAPNRIYLYTTDEEIEIAYTLQNVFQERLKVFSLYDFPKSSLYETKRID